MKTKWDYTELADAYLKRPAYSPEALEEIFRITGVRQGDPVCDIGAGAAHLTIPLAQKGLVVTAVEPNDAMRANGMQRTKDLANVTWVEASGEDTGLPGGTFALVSFGSSFNVLDRSAALAETARLLREQRWFVCMWNHRDLEDDTQSAIENIIKRHIPDYDYGTRREDQTQVICESGLFDSPVQIQGTILHQQPIGDVINAWRSHATLQRQAGERFKAILEHIEAYLLGLASPTLTTPYITRAWVARKCRP